MSADVGPGVPAGRRLTTPDVIVGLQRERLPVVTYVDAYYWSCQECGWLGTGLFSIDAAQHEAGDHYRSSHANSEVYIFRKDVRSEATP